MSDLTSDEKIKIQKKLEYIGLDLENIPEFIKNYRPLEFRPIRGFNENKSRIYKYINVKDIQIYITSKNKMDSLLKKYEKSNPLYDYLKLESEDDIVRHSIFLKMVDKINIEEVERLSNEQDLLNEQVPFEVKYSENYLWQIYYSDITKQYFMMVTIDDEEFEAFFYLLKKQIEAYSENKDIYIYVPVCNTEYSGNLLTRNEISDTENYIWLFTKDWPFIYEVYDKNGVMNLYIIGNTICYERIVSHYKIVIRTAEEAAKFFKLIKALFILQTETNGKYIFKPIIKQDGSLEFSYNGNIIEYEDLSNFIKTEFNKIDNQINDIVVNINKCEKRKQELSKEEKQKVKEFQDKEKAISIYLDCRHSFFGKIRFFMKNKKKLKGKAKEVLENKNKVEEKSEVKEIVKEDDGIDRTKEFLTIEDLVLLVKAFDRQDKQLKNDEMDVRALENKIKVLDSKINNAITYLKEIDEHNKSIFDFWKFANKDNNLILADGESEEEEVVTKLDKTFDYWEDLEDVGKDMDKIIRKLISKKECDSIFLATTEMLKYINEVKNNSELDNSKMKLLENELNEIKDKTTIVSSLFPKEEYDIFGGLSEDKTKIRVLAGRKHREIEKNMYRVIDVNKNTSLERFIEKLRKIVEDIEKSLEKIKAPMNLALYIAQENVNKNNFEVYHINPEEAINDIDSSNEKICRINIKKGMPLIFLTNTIYYDNYNKTLPEGMELSDLVLIDNSKFDFIKKQDTLFRINKKVGRFEYKNCEIHIKEYNLKLKSVKKEEKNDK